MKIPHWNTSGDIHYMAHSFYACYFRKCCKYCLLIAKNYTDYWTYLARPFFGFNSRVRHGEVFSWVNWRAISQNVNNDITMTASLSTAPEQCYWFAWCLSTILQFIWWIGISNFWKARAWKCGWSLPLNCAILYIALIHLS